MGRANLNKQFLTNLLDNSIHYTDYFNRLQTIAMSIFEWVNLPESCNSRFLEYTLFWKGLACFVNDPNLGLMNLEAIPNGKYNLYNLPTKINAFSIGYSENYELDDIILVMNNILMNPTVSSIQLYAQKLANVEVMKQINLNALKTPIMIVGDKSQQLTLENLFKQYNGNYPFIFGDKKANLTEALKVLKTDAPYLVAQFEEEKRNIWSEILTFLGINNLKTNKKERLITNEVDSNNEEINFNLYSFYQYRKAAADELNKKFNLNVEVRLNNRLPQILKERIDVNE